MYPHGYHFYFLNVTAQIFGSGQLASFFQDSTSDGIYYNQLMYLHYLKPTVRERKNVYFKIELKCCL